MSPSQAGHEIGERKIGRSVLALMAGFFATVLLSLGTDFLMHAIGFFPEIGQPMGSDRLAVATAYRTLYSVLSSYIVARLAPYKPMGHAMLGGCIGVVLGAAGAAATWNRNFGPHWYPIALIVIAMPTAWAGGELRVLQSRRAPE